MPFGLGLLDLINRGRPRDIGGSGFFNQHRDAITGIGSGIPGVLVGALSDWRRGRNDQHTLDSASQLGQGNADHGISSNEALNDRAIWGAQGPQVPNSPAWTPDQQPDQGNNNDLLEQLGIQDYSGMGGGRDAGSMARDLMGTGYRSSVPNSPLANQPQNPGYQNSVSNALGISDYGGFDAPGGGGGASGGGGGQGGGGFGGGGFSGGGVMMDAAGFGMGSAMDSRRNAEQFWNSAGSRTGAG